MANETVNMYLQLKPIYTKQLNEMTKSLHQMLDNMNANPSFIKQKHLTVARLEVKAIQQMQIPKPLNSTTFRVRFKPSLVATDDTISLEFSMTPDLEGLLNDMPAQSINVINILHINLEKMSYIQLQNIRKLLQSYKHNMTYWAAKPTNLFVELDKEMYWFCLDTNEQKKTKEKITAYEYLIKKAKSHSKVNVEMYKDCNGAEHIYIIRCLHPTQLISFSDSEHIHI